MRLLRQVTALVGWFLLFTAIPAVALYPLMGWMAVHTQISESALTNSYIAAIGLLFLPTAFLVDFIYGRLVRDRRKKL